MPRSFPDDPRPWKVLSRQYLSRKLWYTVRLEKLELPNGAIIPEYWINEYPPWVNVVAVTSEDRVVLLRQYRPGIEAVYFEIPAGTTELGEASLEAAARRELLEETGYGGGRWSLLATLSANPALQNNLAHTFLAEGVELEATPAPEASEDLRVHLVRVSELAAMLAEGEFIQALHAAPLYKYLLERRGREGAR